MTFANRANRMPVARAAAGLIALGLALAACTSTAAPDVPAATGTGASTDSSAGSSATRPPSSDLTTPASATPSSADQWRQRVTLSPLAVPTEMTLSADREDLGGMIGPVAGRPATVAAIRTTPDGHRHLRATTWDGAAWRGNEVGTGAIGEPQQVRIAGSAEVAAMAGWAWAAGSTAPYLLTSTDRGTWTPIDLPDSLAGYRLLAVGADGDRVVAAGQNRRGAVAVVTLDGAAATPPVVTDLPPAPDRRSRTVTDLAVVGDTLLLVTGHEVVRSVDGARSWTDPAPISGSDWARVNGITAVAGGYLATGSDRADQAGSDRRASAWFSPDGVSWQVETLPEPDGFRRSGDDSWAGPADGSGHEAWTVIASDTAVAPQVVGRRSTGEWVPLGAPADDVTRGFGFGGQAVPGGPDPAGTVLVAIQGALGLTLGQLTGGAWTASSAPTVVGPVKSFPSAPAAEPQVWEADLQLPHFDLTEGVGWRRWLSLSSVRLSGDALVVIPPDPPEATLWTVRGYAGVAELAVISNFVQDRLTVLGWFRTAPDQPWTPTTGFGADRWEQASAAGNVGGLWLIAGGRQADITRDSREQAMIWYSTDGVAWSRAEGDFGVDDRTSSIVGFCPAPDGRRAAVGRFTTGDDARHAALWIEQDGRWQRHELPTDPGWTSAFDSCVDVAGTLVINGSLGSGYAQWTWAQDSGFTDFDPPDLPGAGSREFHDIAAVAGGYAAVGRLDAPAFTGPVVWLSTDGRSWLWLALPVNRPDAGVLTAAVGPDLLVLSSSSTGSQAWRIPDVASVISRMPAAP